MKCPYCKKEIELNVHECAGIMGKLGGSKGGKKSRRVLTTEQAKAMAEAKKQKKTGAS